ncbi:MAG TPA: PEP-CTERM sorting domain-containing protein [Tepidisphaeraceae bacterium]|jgi:hypothetical protein
MKSLALFCAATAALASFTFAPATSAAVITYNESTGGDLKSSFPRVAFTLDVGANTFTGNAGLSDTDALTATIPAGMQLNFASVVQSPSGTLVPEFVWNLHAGDTLSPATLIDDVTVRPPGSGSFENLPLGSGTYLLFLVEARGSTFDDTANYTWTFNVVAVPEPATLALFGLGSLALIARRCRA